MATVLRTDRAALRAPTITSQGFYRADAHAARVGILEYHNDDGTIRRELRPHSEVSDPASLASYDQAPVTIQHPRNPDGTPGKVTAANVDKLEVGSVSGPGRMDDDHVGTTVVLKHDKAIKRARGGLQQLSAGYEIELDETPGEDKRYAYPGNPQGRYDAVQRRIRVNHVALVDHARSGSTTRLRIDGSEMLPRIDADLTAAARHKLPGSMFADPKHEGLPMEDAGHVRAAMSRFGEEKWASDDDKRAGYRKVLARAKALDIDAAGFTEKWGHLAARADGYGGDDVDLTSIAKGHQHTICTKPSGTNWDGTPLSWDHGTTSWAVSDDAGDKGGHQHDWVRNADGSITIAMSDGHAHTILEDDDMPKPATVPQQGYGAGGETRSDQMDRSVTPPHRGVMAATAPPPDDKEQIRLLTVRADEADRVAVQRQDALTAVTGERDAARAELVTLQERCTALQAQIDAGTSSVETAAVLEQRTRADAAEHALEQERRQQPERVRQRAGLVAKARAVIGEQFRCDSLQDREILIAGIRKLRPKEDVGPHVSTEYLSRRFDSLIDDRTAHSTSLARASLVLEPNRPAPPPAARPATAWADTWTEGAGQFATGNRKGG